MKKIRFYNNGTLNEESFRMMGVSVKADDSKIGKFGTGLKYAIAGILRTGGNISIKTRGTDNEVYTYIFTTESQNIRGKDFDVILCNGEKLAYCTDYGKHWKAWQWFRELHSNALDEGGDSTNKPIDGFDTVVTVKHPEIETCWNERDKYFLDANIPVVETINDNQILDCSKGNAYCKGVLVGTMDIPLSVNFADADLTEDRTINCADQQIACLLAQSENSAVIQTALTSNYPNYHAIWSNTPVSEKFLDAIELALVNCRKLANNLANIHNNRRGEIQRESFEPTQFQQIKLTKAIEFLKGAGVEVEAPIEFVKTREGDDLYGYAKDDKIFLTDKAFDHGLHDLVQTVLEEHYHLTTGHRDETRGFQQFLFRQLVGQMEIATNNPL
jgi:hypothetical protein